MMDAMHARSYDYAAEQSLRFDRNPHVGMMKQDREHKQGLPY